MLDTPAAMAMLKQGQARRLFRGRRRAGRWVERSSGQSRRRSWCPSPGRSRDVDEEPSPRWSRAAMTYPGQAPVGTVSTRALWIVRDSVPDALVYGITRALFNPANRRRLDRQPSFRARNRAYHRGADAAGAAASGRGAFLCRSRARRAALEPRRDSVFDFLLRRLQPGLHRRAAPRCGPYNP